VAPVKARFIFNCFLRKRLVDDTLPRGSETALAGPGASNAPGAWRKVL